jgi:hypothetical protein
MGSISTTIVALYELLALYWSTQQDNFTDQSAQPRVPTLGRIEQRLERLKSR